MEKVEGKKHPHLPIGYILTRAVLSEIFQAYLSVIFSQLE